MDTPGLMSLLQVDVVLTYALVVTVLSLVDTGAYAASTLAASNVSRVARGALPGRPEVATIPGAPYFLSTQKIVSVFRGKMAELPCRVKFLGSREVAWRRQETDEFLAIGKLVWSKDPRLTLEHKASKDDVTEWNIVLRNVQDEDAGRYECQITSATRMIWTLQLNVLEPVTTPKPSNDNPWVEKQISKTSLDTDVHNYDERRVQQVESHLTVGMPLRLECNASREVRRGTRSRPEWFKDGVKLESGNGVILTRYQYETDRMYVIELGIDHVTMADSGEFMCRVKDVDLLLAKIIVLPDTEIGGARREDRSRYTGVDQKVDAEPVKSKNGCAERSLPNILILVLLTMLLHTINVRER